VAALPFPVVGHCRNHLATLYSGSPWSKMPELRLEFRRDLLQFQWYNYFRFGGHIAISGCRSILQSLVDTFCELALVETLRFAVGIVLISYCRRYQYFRFRWPHCYFWLSVNVAFICGQSLVVRLWRAICLFWLPVSWLYILCLYYMFHVSVHEQINVLLLLLLHHHLSK